MVLLEKEQKVVVVGLQQFLEMVLQLEGKEETAILD